MTILSSHFTSCFLNERTEHFTGRDWVFRAIGDWLRDAAGASVFLLAGGPGTGKTAIAARLAQMSLGEVAAAHPALGKDHLACFHFCQSGIESTLSPTTFVQALSQALANRYPAFPAALQQAGSRQIVIQTVQSFGTLEAGSQAIGVQIGEIHIHIKGGDARPLFDEAVRRPLVAMASTLPPGARIVILVDSLDEALVFGTESNIAQLLGLASDFPPAVRFLLTARSKSERVFDRVGAPTLDLLADPKASVDEVKTYVFGRLAEVAEAERGTAADRIAAKSEGNFLYAHHLVNDLLARGASLSDADTLDLPDALEGVYRRYLEREVGSSRARWNDVYRPLLADRGGARRGADEGAADRNHGSRGRQRGRRARGVRAVPGGRRHAGGSVPHLPPVVRDFLLGDEKFNVYPAERHAAIARYLQDLCGASWGRCTDAYALR